jgi:hypothetical protein
MAASTATFTSSSQVSDGNELSLSGEGEPESSASSWAVARGLWEANGKEWLGGGVRYFYLGKECPRCLRWWRGALAGDWLGWVIVLVRDE